MELLTIKQSAEILGVSTQSVYNLINFGTIRREGYTKIEKPVYRIYRSEIDRLLVDRGGKGRLPAYFSKRAIKS